MLPVNKDGIISLEHHETWLNKRKDIEASRLPHSSKLSPTSGAISSAEDIHSNGEGVEGLLPAPDDVLFGRGKTVVDHPGNVRFRQIVDTLSRKYEGSGRLEKTCIAQIIVRMVKENTGRFLKREGDGGWEEVDEITARRKVAHAFRNRWRAQGS